MRLIAVVAGSPSENDRLISSQRLLEYGFRFFATQKLVSKDSEITVAKVWGGKIDVMVEYCSNIRCSFIPIC